jgi:hypothetical protein
LRRQKRRAAGGIQKNTGQKKKRQIDGRKRVGRKMGRRISDSLLDNREGGKT